MSLFGRKPKPAASGGTPSPKRGMPTVSPAAVAAMTAAHRKHVDAITEVKWARYEGRSPETIARLEREARAAVIEYNRAGRRR